MRSFSPSGVQGSSSTSVDLKKFPSVRVVCEFLEQRVCKQMPTQDNTSHIRVCDELLVVLLLQRLRDGTMVDLEIVLHAMRFVCLPVVSGHCSDMAPESRNAAVGTKVALDTLGFTAVLPHLPMDYHIVSC